MNCGKRYPINAGPFICKDHGDKEIVPVRVIIGLLAERFVAEPAHIDPNIEDLQRALQGLGSFDQIK